MSDLNDYKGKVINSGNSFSPTMDEGLRAYMISVYNLMALGMFITGIVSFLISNLATTEDMYHASANLPNGILLTNFGVMLYTSPLSWIVVFAPVAMSLFMQLRIQYLSTYAARMTFLAYSALIGLSLSSVFLYYTSASIVQTFFITAASFGSLSLYGYSTKRDLGPVRSFLIMGLFGIFLALLVNLFFKSSAFDLAISCIGLIVFAGLTAYDTQTIKEAYSEHYCADVTSRQSVLGALQLYMDFINLFVFMLRFLGNRRD